METNRRIRKIVNSTKEPSKDCLWLKNGELFEFRTDGWKLLLNKETSIPNDSSIKIVDLTGVAEKRILNIRKFENEYKRSTGKDDVDGAVFVGKIDKDGYCAYCLFTYYYSLDICSGLCLLINDEEEIENPALITVSAGEYGNGGISITQIKTEENQPPMPSGFGMIYIDNENKDQNLWLEQLTSGSYDYYDKPIIEVTFKSGDTFVGYGFISKNSTLLYNGININTKKFYSISTIDGTCTEV